MAGGELTGAGCGRGLGHVCKAVANPSGCPGLPGWTPVVSWPVCSHVDSPVGTWVSGMWPQLSRVAFPESTSSFSSGS